MAAPSLARSRIPPARRTPCKSVILTHKMSWSAASLPTHSLQAPRSVCLRSFQRIWKQKRECLQSTTSLTCNWLIIHEELKVARAKFSSLRSWRDSWAGERRSRFAREWYSTQLFTNHLKASLLAFTASLPKQKHSRAKSRQLRRLGFFQVCVSLYVFTFDIMLFLSLSQGSFWFSSRLLPPDFHSKERLLKLYSSTKIVNRLQIKLMFAVELSWETFLTNLR